MAIYLPDSESIGPALPASLPGTRVPDAEETETCVKFDWLAEALADLGRLNGFRRNFDFFATVDEDRSSMERTRQDTWLHGRNWHLFPALDVAITTINRPFGHTFRLLDQRRRSYSIQIHLRMC